MCIVRKSTYELTISYSVGDKFRKETYGIVSPDHQSLVVIEVPDDAEPIRTWASSRLTLFDVEVYDGRFSYSYDTGRGVGPASADPGATVNVRRDRDAWAQSIMPLTDQWPFIQNVGPMKVLKDAPDMPAGCVLLRYEGDRLRRDWYVDPARDYICVRQAEFAAADIHTRQVERIDLTRLPSGQWYAKTVHTPNTVELDVRLLSDSEIRELSREDEPTGFFNGEKLVKEARDRGGKVPFRAR